MNEIEEIFREVLDEIRPLPNEIILINNIVSTLKKLIGKKAEELNIKYISIEPQGSTGIKQTQLRNDFDIDMFIGLDYDFYKKKYTNLKKKKFKKKIKDDFLWLCKEWIIKALKGSEFHNFKLLYAEHPYVQTNYDRNNKKIRIDIVLYFDLDLEYIKKNGPITAVDRSPWHGKFVKDSLTDGQKDEVRLLKQFFKACHSYGDRSAVGRVGFIGYSAELLIYHYKNILTVFENFNNLKETPLDYYRRSHKELNKIKHFENDSLIIIDPIDKNRNVASAISEKAYKYCNSQISSFLKTPDKQYFEIKEIPSLDIERSKELIENLFILESQNIDEDTHYTETRDKLYSLGDFIKTHGEKEYTHEQRFGNIFFEVYFEVSQKEYNLALYCENPTISETYDRKGPPISSKKHVKKFKEKNANYFEKDGFLWTKSKREYYKFLTFMTDKINKRIPENLKIINISNSKNVQTISGSRALYILDSMVLPYI